MSKLISGLLLLGAVLIGLWFGWDPYGYYPETPLRAAITGGLLGIFFLSLAGLIRLSGREGSSGSIKVSLLAVVILLPLALMAGLEASTDLDRWDQSLFPEDRRISDYAAYEDFTKLKPWLYDTAPYQKKNPMKVNGLQLCWPISIPGFNINSDGLRAPEWTPKPEGEWRIGVVGASNTWGSWVFDRDTIPGFLGRLIKEAGYDRVRVYNLGLRGSSLHNAVKLLEMFQPKYRFDQLVFYHGGGEFSRYLNALLPKEPPAPMNPELKARLNQFRLYGLFKKLAEQAMSAFQSGLDPDSPEVTKRVESQVRNYYSVYQGVKEYCDSNHIRADFFLQPFLFTKPHRTELEETIWRNSASRWPTLELGQNLAVEIVMAKHPGTHHDIRGCLADEERLVYGDWAHMNKIGNLAVARAIFQVISRTNPWPEKSGGGHG